MRLEGLLHPPVYTYERVRCAGYTIENRLLHLLARLILPKGDSLHEVNPGDIGALRQEVFELLDRDSRMIVEGKFPWAVLKPESPFKHFKRLPKVAVDVLRASLQKRSGRTTVFNRAAQRFLADLPSYYRRNFHFQNSGYLSDRSAELYDHQVEILFGGAADAMRRLILPPIQKAIEGWGAPADGHGLRSLEIGAGTGRSTEFVRLAFPRAKIVAVDLSDPYLKKAQRELARFPLVDFVQADGAHLPFRDGEFDVVYSVFLFHELPMEERVKVLRESVRVLRSGGILGMVDSMQQGEKPELDSILELFPKDYHEPFFRNYITHPMETLLREAGLDRVEKDLGFVSKVCWGQKS